MRELKATLILAQNELMKPGQAVVWPMYTGEDIEEANTVHNYAKAFFMTAEPMPIPDHPGVRLHILSLAMETIVGDHPDTYKVVAEGEFVEPKDI